MAERDEYRKISSFELRPMYVSLGVPQSAFIPSSFASRTRLFDAALNADISRPDTLWLFKGPDYFSFNLRTGSFEGDALPLTSLAGGAWPLMFAGGIDAAAWAGAAYPNLWYFFKGDHFLRMNSSTPTWTIDIGPKPTGHDWFQTQDAWFKGGAVPLLGLSPKYAAKLHLFKGGEYLRHDFNDGNIAQGPVPINTVWHLPEPFASKIDMAFYGTAENEESVFFFSGDHVALYDTKLEETLKVSPIEERFPAFARFMTRPQVFLVESYQLETYVGPPRLGKLVETKSILPGHEGKTVLVTETLDSRTDRLHSSLLESQDEAVVNNFNKQMDRKAEKDASSDRYRYQMNAQAHGEANYTFLGGEVNVEAAVQGGSDDVRERLAQSTFETIESQVTESAKQINQRTVDSAADIEHKERVLKQEEIVLKNRTERKRDFEFYQQLQPYITLLVLTDVRVAYLDGAEGPKIAPLSGLAHLLDGVIADDAQKQKILRYVAGELAAVRDHEGQAHPVIKPVSPEEPGVLERAPNGAPAFTVQLANGATQQIVTRGLMIKAVKDDWIKPTMSIIAVENTSS